MAHRQKQIRFLIHEKGDETKNRNEESEDSDKPVQRDQHGESGIFNVGRFLSDHFLSDHRVSNCRYRERDCRKEINHIKAKRRADPCDVDWSHFYEKVFSLGFSG